MPMKRLLTLLSAAALFAALVSLFLYPLVGRFDFNWKKVLGNSIFLTLRHLPYAVCMLLLILLAALGSWLFTYGIIFLPPIAFYLDGKLLLWIFDRYMEDDGEKEETD